MAAYEAVANIDFQEVDISEAEMVHYKYTDADAAQDARESELSIPGLDWTGWLDHPGDYGTVRAPIEGLYISDPDHGGHDHVITPWLIAHELGHGLGLSHPHGSPYESHPTTPWPDVTASNDTGEFGFNSAHTSVMSYGVYNGAQAQGPMVFDIEALQAMYGANTTTNAGDTSHNLATGRTATIYDVSGNDTLVGTNGHDIINLASPTLDQTATGAGGFSYRTSGGATGGTAIGPGTVIENANGGDGDDTISGNGIANTLIGGNGNDTISAGAGADSIYGNGGIDDLNLGNDTAADTVYARDLDTVRNFDSGEDKIDLLGLGIDKVWTSGSGTSWMLYASTNGIDNIAEIEITLLQSDRPLSGDLLW
jgi:serralysin